MKTWPDQVRHVNLMLENICATGAPADLAQQDCGEPPKECTGTQSGGKQS